MSIGQTWETWGRYLRVFRNKPQHDQPYHVGIYSVIALIYVTANMAAYKYFLFLLREDFLANFCTHILRFEKQDSETPDQEDVGITPAEPL